MRPLRPKRVTISTSSAFWGLELKLYIFDDTVGVQYMGYYTSLADFTKRYNPAGAIGLLLSTLAKRYDQDRNKE